MPIKTPPLWIVWIAWVGFCFSACTTNVPYDDYTLARTAIEAAKDAEAARYAPGLWYKAEDAYKRGEKAFKERDYADAQKRLLEAKLFAERAENAARLNQFESGRGGP